MCSAAVLVTCAQLGLAIFSSIMSLPLGGLVLLIFPHIWKFGLRLCLLQSTQSGLQTMQGLCTGYSTLLHAHACHEACCIRNVSYNIVFCKTGRNGWQVVI